MSKIFIHARNWLPKRKLLWSFFFLSKYGTLASTICINGNSPKSEPHSVDFSAKFKDMSAAGWRRIFKSDHSTVHSGVRGTLSNWGQ